MYLKQSTNSQQRLVGPFVSDSDFKTVQTGLTIANTDVKLSKNGASGANKNSGGGTHRNNGMYALTFDATDTDTVGELALSIVVSGALVVAARYFVLEESIYDALFAASAAGFDANQRVDVAKVGGTTQTAGDIFARLGAPAGASVSADIAAVKSDTGSVKTTVDTNLNATVSSRATPAQVNTEVVDALATDTYAEPGQGAPPATATLAQKVAYLYKAWRNKITQTNDAYALYNDAGDTVDQTAATSDDGTTFQRDEIASGP